MGPLTALRAIAKPHYVFRPSQLVRRLVWKARRGSAERVTVRLPWGMPIRCFAHDSIGLTIQQHGVFELTVAEALWRLADPGETALDIGANVGQMTAVLAYRVGHRGRVLAFEPNDEVRAELEYNVGAWKAAGALAEIQPMAVALSDRNGDGELLLPSAYEWNRGLASVAAQGSALAGRRIPIRLARLDDVIADDVAIGVAKLDVEGHEELVLRGATALLAAGRIRDIVFEDHARYPTNVSRLLEQSGYRVLALGSVLWGPRVGPPDGPSLTSHWESPNYLATRDIDRAQARLRPRGWRVL